MQTERCALCSVRDNYPKTVLDNESSVQHVWYTAVSSTGKKQSPFEFIFCTHVGHLLFQNLSLVPAREKPYTLKARTIINLSWWLRLPEGTKCPKLVDLAYSSAIRISSVLKKSS